ncbi:imidazolonepropionase-like domain-containing protein [Streptomyces gobiensis]|uniref:imidazolonepropionase-like domain-containing protein n=1 Tax=Streptomyces gobiensis TaxID=2875706 RepID=UPI001E337B7A|nr:hypothetical protein [Streptomyces gobiensis]UGY92964.1 hypothetical protein test1122_15435 [Streptomyces gobiensis]
MLTLHVPSEGDALAVEGDRIAAIGPYEELAAAYPAARVRRWAGALAPGHVAADAVELLEGTYHPDPREADTESPAVAELTDSRWGQSARRGVQRLLGEGVTAVVGPFTRPAVRTAVQRSGLRVLPAAPRELSLAVGMRADFAVFDASGRCVATVIGGRLVYRAR